MEVTKRLRKTMEHVRGLALDVLFPRRCVGCKREGTVWCRACADAFASGRPSAACPFCAAPGSDAACAACRPHRALDGLTAAFAYGDPAVRGAVTGYKFTGDEAYADVLARWLEERVPSAGLPTVDAVIAIPLHPTRLRSRGFNQADLVAHQAGVLLDLPVVAPLIRTRKTAPQSGLAHDKRQADGLAGAFACAAPVPARILLCDDVFTSGATLDAAAAALKAAGAEFVWGFTIAKG